jgi:Cu2+-exporting ATPase
VDTVVLDKTGTLTLPQPEVVNAADVPPEVLALAGRLALASSHPLAAAIARAAGAKVPLDGVIEEPGQGVRAVIDGAELRLGRPSWCDAEREAQALALAHADSAIAFRRGDERYAFAVCQQPRPDAAAVVAALRARGLQVEILSGDRTDAVKSVARAVGIDTWRAGVTPVEKIGEIEALKRKGRKVLMVGDGLNDAPALAAAYVSLSPITAVHLSQAAADAVFLGERLAPVAEALVLAHRAKQLMRENLWLAVIYNAIAVPIAIAGLATPLVAAAAMSGSSILVTANALRARAPGAPWKS